MLSSCKFRCWVVEDLRESPKSWVDGNRYRFTQALDFTFGIEFEFFSFSPKQFLGSVFNLCLCISALRRCQYLSEIKDWEINVLKKFIVTSLLGCLLTFRITSLSINAKTYGLFLQDLGPFLILCSSFLLVEAFYPGGGLVKIQQILKGEFLKIEEETYP